MQSDRWLPAALAAIGAAAVALWLFVAWRQIFFPLELFGHEGAIVDHIRRLLDGQPIYGPPELEFVPFLYTPGYYLICAAFAWAGELAFVVPRMVSAIATLGSMTCLAILGRHFSGSLLWGAIAAGAFALGASVVQAWYALAQVENVFLFCLALAVTLGCFARSGRSFLLVGLIFAAAFWCKQVGLAAGVVYAAALALLDWRRSFAVLIGLGVGIAPGVVLLQLLSDGWFGFYVFAVPAHFHFEPVTLLMRLARDFVWMAPGCLAGLFVLWRLWRLGRKETAISLVALALGLSATAALGRSHPGGHVNTLMPAVWVMALALGAGIGMLWRIDVLASSSPLPRLGLAIVVLLQFGLLAYDPRHYLPASNGAAVRAQIAARLATARPPLFMSGMGYLVGRVAGADHMALNDLLRTDPALGDRYRTAFDAALKAKRYGSVIVDEALGQPWSVWYEPYYRPAKRLSDDIETLRPRAGLDFGPPVILEAR